MLGNDLSTVALPSNLRSALLRAGYKTVEDVNTCSQEDLARGNSSILILYRFGDDLGVFIRFENPCRINSDHSDRHSKAKITYNNAICCNLS